MGTSTGRCLGALLLGGLAVGALAADLLDDLTRPNPGVSQRASSGLYDPESNLDAHHVRPGENLLLADLRGPGEIRHLWFTLASADRRYPRSVVLRIFWDNATVPAVETPIGDFFAAGNGMRANVDSIPVSVSSYGRALNCYWRMPFGERAVIEVANEGTERVTVYFQADWLALPDLPAEALRFHARYRQSYPAEPFQPYVVFDGVGAGHYVGTVYSSQNLLANWFGEADDRFYVDGESVPSIVGTGTEDYFNDAWNLRLHSHGRRGVTICETKGEERRITAYRWHLDDAITYRTGLRVEMERRSYVLVPDPETGRPRQYDFRYRPDYVSSVAFWYQPGTMERRWPFPSLAERQLPEIWVEPAQMADEAATSPGITGRRAANRTCHQKVFYYLRNDAPGGWVEFPFTVEREGRYAVSAFQSLFGEYGVWRVSLIGPAGEQVLDDGLDFWDSLAAREENWPENWHHGTTVETKLGEVRLGAGAYRVRFECVGSNPLSRHPETGAFGQGYSLGLDAVNLRWLPVDPADWARDYLPAEEQLFARFEAEAREQVDRLAGAIATIHDADGAWPAALPAAAPDPWGMSYRYRAPGLVHPWGFDVWSCRGNSRRAVGWIGNWQSPLDLAREAPPGAVVIEGEQLALSDSSTGAAARPQTVQSEVEAPLSGGALLLLDGQPGAWVELSLPDGLPAGEYDAYLFGATSWDYGTAQWRLNVTPLGEPLDGYSDRIGMTSRGPYRLRLTGTGDRLRCEWVGRNARSAGSKAGLDALVLVPR